MTPYQNVAKAALINWNGLSEEEAMSKIQSESVQQLEGQVYAMGSMKYATLGIAQQLGLNNEQIERFFNAIINGPENDEIFAAVAQKAQNFTDDQKLNVLSTIHDGWVQDNSSDKTFQKKYDRQQLRQYAPLELIGWNEVRSDLLFLSPILEAISVSLDENKLADAYHNRVANYLNKMNINSAEDLTSLVEQGTVYYSALPDNLSKKLEAMGDMISAQIQSNWANKDPETNAIFSQRIQSEAMHM